MWSSGIVDLPFKVIGTKNKNIPKRLQAKNLITTDVEYFLFSMNCTSISKKGLLHNKL